MRTLLMDTSADHVAVALFDGENVIFDEYRKAERRYNSVIIDLIQEACSRAQIKPSDIGAYGAVMGPGTFTGVRVGIAVAKAMCRATGADFYGASSLEIIANSAGVAGNVMALLDARRGEVYAAGYEITAENSRIISGPLLVKLDDIKKITGQQYDVIAAIKRDQQLLSGAGQAVFSEHIDMRAFYRIINKGGAKADLYASAPVYVRKPDAEIKRS